MPTYVYQCDDCGHDFEAFQKFSEDPLSVCPECQGHIRRVLQPSPVIFKGSGWYINDSRSKSSANGVAKKDDAADGAKSDDAKPAKAEKSEKPEKAEKAPALASAD